MVTKHLTEKEILSEFQPAPFFYSNVPIHKGIKKYDIRKLKLKPKVAFSQLGTSGIGPAKKYPFKYSGATKINMNTAGGQKNNPLNISHAPTDVGYIGTSKVADGQPHAAYNSVENGIASALSLLKVTYGCRSIIGYNNGFQGYLDINEGLSLSALRVVWITNFSNRTGIPPDQIMDINDKDTLFNLCHFIAIQETGSLLGRSILEAAYKKSKQVTAKINNASASKTYDATHRPIENYDGNGIVSKTPSKTPSNTPSNTSYNTSSYDEEPAPPPNEDATTIYDEMVDVDNKGDLDNPFEDLSAFAKFANIDDEDDDVNDVFQNTKNDNPQTGKTVEDELSKVKANNQEVLPPVQEQIKTPTISVQEHSWKSIPDVDNSQKREVDSGNANDESFDQKLIDEIFAV